MRTEAAFLRSLATIFVLAGGTIHLAASRDHPELPVLVVGFLAMGAAQLGVALLLHWHAAAGRRLAGLMIAVGLAAVMGPALRAPHEHLVTVSHHGGPDTSVPSAAHPHDPTTAHDHSLPGEA